jgi:deferrochelatase/peroxidase EfeB
MTIGQTAAPLSDHPLAPPEDTGEGLGLPPSRLTLTFGFGPTLFTATGFDIAPKRPAALVDLPQFKNDNLEAARCGGDICVQACADDPQVAFHAVRNLARIGRGAVAMRWSQLGFSRASAVSHDESTPRNLMGFKDGTNNIQYGDGLGLGRFVWAGGETPWMQGGTYLVARRIRMRIETWDRSPLLDQENTIGRAKITGAALGQRGEFDTVDLEARDTTGGLAVPLDAHIRLAAPATNSNEKILRRGYSFTDGMDSYGELDAGLFFVSFQRDPREQFIPIQQRLAESDALNEYISHTGSAIFACPPGVRPGGWIGETLFA